MALSQATRRMGAETDRSNQPAMTAPTKATPDQMYEFIVAFIRRHGYSPTTREIAAGVGLEGISAVQRTLYRLRDDERITWVPGRTRTIRPVGD